MRLPKYIIPFLTGIIVLTSCNNGYKFKLTTSKKVVLNKKATATLQEVNGKPIDSIHFYINNKRITSKGNSITIDTKTLGTGKYVISALAFYPNKTKKLNNSIEVLSNKTPDIYTYKIINTYPHDKTAYTQGLEFYNGFLYETTGKRGKSTLRKVELKTGKVLQKVDLDAKYFGEGMTIFNNKIYWLTWEAGKGFIYDLETFKQEGEFSYTRSTQGWGLTHNDTHLIKSDGTHKIWFLDPITQKEKYSIQAYHHKGKISLLNEIEIINGKIFANYWLTQSGNSAKSTIAIIDPKSGIVEGLIDLNGLKKEVEKTQRLANQDEVLNGIAYDAKNNRIYVTGKHWGKLFEIELIKK